MSTLIAHWETGAMKRPAANAPSASRTAGTNFPWDALNFDDAADEYVCMFGVMPEADVYTATGNVEVEVSWVTDTSTTGDVRWQADILGRVSGEAYDVAFSENDADDSARAAGDALHVLTLTITSPTLAPGDDFVLKITRDANHANDDYGADADLVRVRLLAV